MVADRGQFFTLAGCPELDLILALGAATAPGDHEATVGAEQGRGGGTAVSAEEAQGGLLAGGIDVHGFVKAGRDHQLAIGRERRAGGGLLVVVQHGQLLARGGVPRDHLAALRRPGFIPGGRYNPTPIGRKDNVLNGKAVTLENPDRRPVGRVPHVHGLVVTGGGQQPTIGRKGDTGHLATLTFQRPGQFSGCCFDQECPLVPPGGQVLPIGRVGQVANVAVLELDVPEALAIGGRPTTDDPVGPRGKLLAIGRDSHAGDPVLESRQPRNQLDLRSFRETRRLLLAIGSLRRVHKRYQGNNRHQQQGQWSNQANRAKHPITPRRQ